MPYITYNVVVASYSLFKFLYNNKIRQNNNELIMRSALIRIRGERGKTSVKEQYH